MAVRPIEVSRSFRLVGISALSFTLSICRRSFRGTIKETKEAAVKGIVVPKTKHWRRCRVFLEARFAATELKQTTVKTTDCRKLESAKSRNRVKRSEYTAFDAIC